MVIKQGKNFFNLPLLFY